MVGNALSSYVKSSHLTWNRYVLSTTHLHEFKSPDRISSQAPVMSLPLADQKLGSHSSAESTSHKFMLKGRQSGGIHRGHAWVFRAESYDTMLAWFSDIKNLTEKTGAERKEFIRQSHARSVSAGSHKAGSISSDGGMDEDEADEVPYSATASQGEIPIQAEKLQQRPDPGGRFPSALKIDRDSQVPISTSSLSSSTSDREVIAAAGALPGCGIQAISPEQTQGIGLSEDPDPAAYDQKQVDSIPRSLPFDVERHDRSCGVWPPGARDGAFNPAGTEACRQEVKPKGLTGLEGQPDLHFVREPGQPAVQGAVFAPSISNGTNDPANLSTLPIRSDQTSIVSDSVAPIKDPISRPSLVSRVATISELHVPGEFPR